jgi:hypothetical protein
MNGLCGDVINHLTTYLNITDHFNFMLTCKEHYETRELLIEKLNDYKNKCTNKFMIEETHHYMTWIRNFLKDKNQTIFVPNDVLCIKYLTNETKNYLWGLCVALYHDNIPLIKYYLDTGIDDQCAIYIYDSYRNSTELIEYYVLANKHEINRRSSDALLYAIKENKINIIECLNNNSIIDLEFGLNLSAEYGRKNMIEYFIIKLNDCNYKIDWKTVYMYGHTNTDIITNVRNKLCELYDE